MLLLLLLLNYKQSGIELHHKCHYVIPKEYDNDETPKWAVGVSRFVRSKRLGGGQSAGDSEF